MIKRYELRVSPCIVPLCIGIPFVWPKYTPINIGLECEYMLPTSMTASFEYPRFEMHNIHNIRMSLMDPHKFMVMGLGHIMV